MSNEDLSRILGRALFDSDFGKKLGTDPERAVKEAGFNLQPNEIVALSEISLPQLSAAAGILKPKIIESAMPPFDEQQGVLKPGGEAAFFDEQNQQQQTGARLAALEARLGGNAGGFVKPGGEAAFFDEQNQQQQTGARLAALETRLGKAQGFRPGGEAAIFDEQNQQQQTGARLAALEARLGGRVGGVIKPGGEAAIFDEQNQV